MAAILPFLETELEKVKLHKIKPEHVLSVSHTELTKLAWARSLVARALIGRNFSVEDDNGNIFVRVTPGVPSDIVPWHKAGGDTLDRFSLFSTNSKMACPTFDLPSGVYGLGGSCPGARWAQSSVEPAERQLSASSAQYAASVVGHELDLDAAVCQRCVAGDTLVMVRGRGLMRIEDCVGLGDIEVWSGVAWRTTHAVMQKVSPTIEVQFAGGRTLRCTADHKVLTTDGMVEAGQLIPGDHQILPALPTDVTPFPAHAALPPVELGAQHFNEVRGVLPMDWSREVGTWLGYVVGDGWFYENSKYPSIGVCGAVADDADLRALAQWATAWSGSQAEVTHGIIKPTDRDIAPNGGTVAHVTWRSKALVAFARSLGLSKQGELCTPAAVWNASQEGVAGYLSGLFSTDGSVARWPTRVAVSFANTSKQLCAEVQQLLFAFGIRSNICEYTSNAARGYKQCWKVDIVANESVHRFERLIGFHNARKAAALRDGLSAAGEVRALNRPISVLAVVPARDAEPVFDLINVGDERQFVANGIPVSNCYASGGKYGEVVVQFSEVARYAFVRSMMEQNPNGLRQLLATVIRHRLHWSREEMSDKTLRRHGIKPIRVHSSGDFFSTEYAQMWMDVARMVKETNPEIRFWAPTRTQVIKGFAEFWAEPGRVPDNFVIRPSAYHLGDHAPIVAGLAKGTSVLTEDQTKAELKRGDGKRFSDGKMFNFQCGVYALGKGDKTCVHSIAPDGKKGCRACWMRPDYSVNYCAH